MQPLASGDALRAYHSRLLSSHDFDVFVDIMDLDEKVTGSAVLLDGQVNIEDGGLVRRKCSLSLSDPDGALDDSLGWVSQLVRVRHVLEVPGVGEVTATPFVGPVTSIGRSGGEVKIELQDKAALAIRGARPLTVPKGMSAMAAIRKIMSYCTGEFRFRFSLPARVARRRLSGDYSVGLADEADPMLVAAKIARTELGAQLLYSCDGYLMLRPMPSSPVVDLGSITDPVQTSADLSKVVNYVKVSGKAVSKKKGNKTTTTQAISVARVKPRSEISPETVSRQGVPRLLPLVIAEDGYTKTSQTAARAAAELKRGAAVESQPSISVVPVFHLDADDIVAVTDETGRTLNVRLSTGSIPLGVGGDMSIGFKRRTSESALGRPHSHYRRKVRTSHKKGHRKGAHK